MRISDSSSERAILEELGVRLRRLRLERNLSQQALAEEGGVGRMTVQRLEEGEPASLTSLIRVLRTLGAAEGLDRLVPAPAPSPLEEMSRQGRRRQRARPPRAEPQQPPPRPWRWGDERGAGA